MDFIIYKITLLWMGWWWCVVLLYYTKNKTKK